MQEINKRLLRNEILMCQVKDQDPVFIRTIYYYVILGILQPHQSLFFLFFLFKIETFFPGMIIN